MKIKKIIFLALIVFLLIILFFPKAVRAWVKVASYPGCPVPESCRYYATCLHIVEPVPSKEELAYLGADVVEYYPAEGSIYETRDDNGAYGGGSSYNQWLEIAVPWQYQSSEWNLLAFWWRMHDHEEEVNFDLEIHRVGGSWERVVNDKGVHTSGEACEEPCSLNTDPQGNEGCADHDGPGNWIPEIHLCDATHRQNWPCALSFDEHLWMAASVPWPAQPADRIRLHFNNDNSHIHINDYKMIFGKQALRPCGDCIPTGCGFLAFSPEEKFASELENSGKVNTEANLAKAEKSIFFGMQIIFASIIEWVRGLFHFAAKFASDLTLLYRSTQ